MPSWKKVILSGSSANLNSLTVDTNVTASSFTGSFTGSFLGTASYAVSASWAPGGTTFPYTGSAIISGSLTLTGSFNVTGSTTQTGNNNLLGNTTLSGSIIISGSTTTPATPTIKVYGDMETNGVIKFDPVNKNIDNSISASYVYVSGSTQDLYFSQNGSGYSNTTRLRWIEGNLYTGILNGGLITSQSSTVYQVGSGSGIIVNLNASTGSNPYPTIQYVNWNLVTQSIAALSASYDQQFVAIQSNGTIFAQGTPFTDGQFNTLIPVGLVLHNNNSTINGVKTQPSLAYGWKQRSSIFTQAFGPLKLSGFTLAPSGSSTGSLVVGSGTAFADGANYPIDPNNPSYVTDTGTSVSKIWRYYQSGSSSNGWVYLQNGGAGYSTIDPTQYSNNGTLTAVPGTGPGRNWSIQRVFWFPNSVSKAIVVYYGNAVYPNQSSALANINIEAFVEAPTTAANAVFLGYILVQNNADFTNSSTYTIVPGGLFRSVGGSGGGGSVITTTLAGLSDVSISGPTDGQALVYSNVSTKWQNSNNISASITGNAATATTASYVTTAQTASYVLNAVSSSYATTASYVTGSIHTSTNPALSASYALTSSYSNTSTTASYVTGSIHTSTNPALSASYALTSSYSNTSTSASYALNSTSASYALTASYSTTASYVNTLNQNVLITGSLTVGTSSLGSNENTLVLGPAPGGGTGEGGQLLLQATNVGGYTSASMFDNYQNLTRLLRGTNVSSDAVVASWNMGTKQMQLPAYNSLSSFTGSLVGYLGFDNNGYLLTVSGSGGGGSTSPGGSSGQIQYNNGGSFGGVSVLTFTGGNLYGTGSFTGSFNGVHTGSLLGTASYASQALTASYSNTSTSASYALNSTSASYALSASQVTSASYAISTSVAISSSYALNSTSASYALNSTSASYALSSSQALTASYVTTAQTASYVLNAVSASQALTASNTPNALITASVSSNTITFTKGNGTTFNITVATGSGGGGGGGNITGSFSDYPNYMVLTSGSNAVTDTPSVQYIPTQKALLGGYNAITSPYGTSKPFGGMISTLDPANIWQSGYFNGTALPNETAATNLFAGQLCFRNSSGQWDSSDAVAEQDTSVNMLGICLKTATTGNTTSILIQGMYSIDWSVSGLTDFSSPATGMPVYMDESNNGHAGNITDITNILSSFTPGEVVRKVGSLFWWGNSFSSNIAVVYFNPSDDYIVL